MYKQIFNVKVDLFSTGVMEEKYLDRFLYRGKGRPRKLDYSPLSVIQQKMNKVFSDRLMEGIYGK